MIWKPLAWIAQQLLWIVPVLATIALVGRAGNRRSARDLGDGGIEFAPSRIAFGAWAVLLVCLAYEAADRLKHGHGKPSIFVTAAFLRVMALLFLVSFPETLVITDDGLQQVYWLRRDKRTRWEEIVEINTGDESRTVTITGGNGTTIIHSRQLADRTRFLLEVKQHCGENLPPDFPRESTAL